jgi:IS30 family transposase
MEKMKKYEYRSLPWGYKGAIAHRLGIHPNTVYHIMQRGEAHPKYRQVMKVLDELRER